MTAGGDLAAVLEAAADEARRAGAEQLGTEHLLLGALRQERAPVVRLLASRGITYSKAAAQYNAVFPSGTPPPVAAPIPESPELKRFSLRATNVLRAAHAMASGPPDLTHLLAAILSERGVSAAIIEGLANDRNLAPWQLTEELNREVRAMLNDQESR